MLRQPLERLTRQMNTFLTATGGIARVRQLLETRALGVDGSGATLPAGALSVELDNVSFAYGSEPVLHEVACCVEPGEVPAFPGRPRSAVTTNARWLFR